MRTLTPVFPNDPHAQQSSDDGDIVDLSSMVVLPQGTTNRTIPSGEFFRLDTVIQASQLVSLSGNFSVPSGLPAKPLTALFYRSDTREGAFKKPVVSMSITPLPTGDGVSLFFFAEIEKTLYAHLFPGFFKVAVRNPKANPPIKVVNFRSYGS
jgi:hypothetical protein